MSSTILNKAAEIRAPHDPGTANDFGHRLFTCTNTIARNAVPSTWKSRWVIIRNVGSVEAHVGFSTRSDATIDPAPTATAAGTSNQVGTRLAPGEVQQRQLPDWADTASLDFIRITASSTTTLDLELGDGE